MRIKDYVICGLLYVVLLVGVISVTSCNSDGPDLNLNTSKVEEFINTKCKPIQCTLLDTDATEKGDLVYSYKLLSCDNTVLYTGFQFYELPNVIP